MYHCQYCNTTCNMSREHLTHISKECQETGLAKTIIICPKCHTAMISGAELEWDSLSSRQIILAFTMSLNSEIDSFFAKSQTSLPAFFGVMTDKQKS